MNRLLVIGGASFDTLHLEDRTVESVGGVGMYTAMAAHRCGARVAMLSLRPDPCPETLRPMADRLAEWFGPAVSPAQLPQFEISYRQGRTRYLNVSLGDVAMLTPGMLPADLSQFDLVHVTQKADLQTQLSFVEACRQRGAKQISSGTFPGDALRYPQLLRAVIDQSDCFFMNELEAGAVFGSLEAASVQAGKVLSITRGVKGACIVQGERRSFIPAAPAAELDPTGAGDTFCGATLAHLLQKKHPIMAASHAAALAAEMIGQVGPAALWSDDPPPAAALDARVRINDGQVRKVAGKLSTLPDVSPYPFVGPEYPPAGHPKAMDYFFAASLQQFSFWFERNNRYHQPLIARIGGVERKGSDYLWYAYKRRLEVDADFCSPERQANLSRQELLEVFRADDGEDPMPALDLHLEMARQYGRDMLALQLTPQEVVRKALESTDTFPAFLAMLDHIGGYKEDPLRKKSALLAMILNQRPEGFLPLPADVMISPVIDYHLMRSCLRVGLIDVVDQALADRLRSRRILSAAEEWAVRHASYYAIEQVTDQSGRDMGLVDMLFFNARGYCPEMSEPECHRCQLDPVCAHRKELFQPVLRTTFY
jgi:sugar/nucleoside kinase (ribokinase family)